MALQGECLHHHLLTIHSKRVCPTKRSHTLWSYLLCVTPPLIHPANIITLIEPPPFRSILRCLSTHMRPTYAKAPIVRSHSLVPLVSHPPPLPTTATNPPWAFLKTRKTKRSKTFTVSRCAKHTDQPPPLRVLPISLPRPVNRSDLDLQHNSHRENLVLSVEVVVLIQFQRTICCLMKMR